ncbi:MAG TPA: hypothetical protein VFI03_05370 [Solirubrobacterales bacterium]|nr:hypothetical protein [Solirubrobacterales bacterium]
MSKADKRSPASRVMDEAIELAIAEESPYPEVASFIDADTPYTAREIERALTSGRSAVVVAKDGSTQIIRPEAAAG